MGDPNDRWRQTQSSELEREFLAELYRHYAPRVAKFFANRRFSPEDVQDLTQETFLSAFRQMGTLRDRGRFEAWLFQIALNKWRNACRDRATARLHVQEMASGEEPEAGNSAELAEGRHEQNPLQNTLTEEKHRLLREALGQLPPPYRNAVLLRLDQDLSYAEIATVLRVPIGTVKSRLNAATQQLRSSLGEVYGEVRL
jgi:RNA polymerase sigma-70 factor (ECF subfamily)